MNKIKYTVVIVLIFLTSSLFSQVNFGLKIGGNYNINNFSSDSLNLELENTTSLLGGGFVRIKIKKLSFQGEALLANKKAEIVNAISGNSKVSFNSFDIPLMVGYKLIDLKVVKLRVNAGLIPSFVIGNGGDLDKANYKDAFYSATAGISLDVPLLLFDLRYQGAIGDYYELQHANSSTTLTNSMITLSVGWKIL
jgi:hypothetical protein